MTQIANKDLRTGAIGFVGNYLPRRCGIATFTYDLAETIAGLPENGRPVFVAAMNDRPRGYRYPSRVGIEIQQDDLSDYDRAAGLFNRNCDVVSLQHEFGIFGGASGAHVLRLIAQLVVPVVVTCHTVYGEPDPECRRVFREIVSRSKRLVVMNRQAVNILTTLYGARREQIVYIKHGIHDMPFSDPPAMKKAFGVEGRVALTFGLLHRNKGIEYMIDAMAEIVRSRPKTTYVIAGRTHPAIVRDEGESYRRELERRVASHGLGKNVIFIDRFADTSDLTSFLADTDIFVAPYLNLDQMTSGALCYAVGAGKAVVATPFCHAKELLADDRGVLVPVRDAHALADAVLDLLNDERQLDSLRRRAYLHTRDMVWSSVAREYLNVFGRVSRRIATPAITERGASLPISTNPVSSVNTARRRDAPVHDY